MRLRYDMRTLRARKRKLEKRIALLLRKVEPLHKRAARIHMDIDVARTWLGEVNAGINALINKQEGWTDPPPGREGREGFIVR